jgi:hypothetical protein
LVSNPDEVADFYQMNIPWSDQDMIFLSCRRSMAVSRAVESGPGIFGPLSNLICCVLLLVSIGCQFNTFLR